MASREQWCADKLSKLLNEDLRITTLNEIKDHLREVSNFEATQTAEILELPLVFDCLNNSNNEQIDLACEVLSLCMEKLDITETTSRYTIPLERALVHPNAGVQLMALTEISRIIDCDITQRDVLVRTLSERHLYVNVISCIGNENLSVATKACSIVTCFATVSPNSLNFPNVLQTIKETMSKNEVVRLRFYEVFIDVCVFGEEVHKIMISTGLLKPIINEMDNKDVLLRCNVIEMLYKMVEKEYGFTFLETQGFMQKLFKQYLNEEDPMFAQLCEPGIMKFFGHMAHCKPKQSIAQYSQVMERIFANIINGDYTVIKVSLETIAYIASADNVCLDLTVGSFMIDTIKSLSERIQTMPTKEKISVLNWLGELLKGPTDETSSAISHKWFNNFSPNPMDLVMHYIRNPFEELRSAGLSVLYGLTLHKWGQEYIKRFPGLIEYLLDRSVETSKHIKVLKYDIVKNIVENPLGSFGSDTMALFEAFAKEGAFYMQAVTEVAVEGID